MTERLRMPNWTNITKPGAQTYTNLNPIGKEQYDQANLTYDDLNTFYDGVNVNQWTNIAKPQNLDQSQLTVTSNETFGGTSTYSQKGSQSFTPLVSGQIILFQISLAKVGSPSDAIKLEIYDNNAGMPGNLLGQADANINGSSLTTDLATQYFTFSSGPVMSANVIYWVVPSRTGSLNNTNYYKIGVAADASYTRGNHLSFYSGTWHDDGGQLYFAEYFTSYIKISKPT